MDHWTDEEALLGRKAFDLWRFTEAPRAIPWDWADMAGHERNEWIELACAPGYARPIGRRRGVIRNPTARAS